MSEKIKEKFSAYKQHFDGNTKMGLIMALSAAGVFAAGAASGAVIANSGANSSYERQMERSYAEPGYGQDSREFEEFFGDSFDDGSSFGQTPFGYYEDEETDGDYFNGFPFGQNGQSGNRSSEDTRSSGTQDKTKV